MKQPMNRKASREIITRLMQISKPTARDLSLIKLQIADSHKLPKIPPNSQIIQYPKPKEKKKLIPILRRKTAPCAYCPGGPSIGVPQSYTGHEPAAMRGLQNRFNPFRQVIARIKQLEAIGHD